MIHSSHEKPKIKAIAEMLAMIADSHSDHAPHHPRPVRETDEWLWESANEFCAAMDRYAGRALQMKSSRLDACCLSMGLRFVFS